MQLREAESLLAKGILGGNDANDLIVTDWLKPEQRMAIYQHHYKATLREALAITFRVVVRLVGENFFNGMADAFTLKHPPSQPCLAEYGDAFPDFIAGFEPAQSLPYLADIALLEWLLTEADHTTNYEGKAFYTIFPVDRIWQTNQPGYRGNEAVSLDEGGGWFVVEKIDDIVQWRVLDLPADAMDKKEQSV